MIRVQKEDFDIGELLSAVKSPRVGGVSCFLGCVRDSSQGRRVERMSIEVYEEMAAAELEKIREEALERFQVEEAVVVHRYGDLEVGDNIVFIAVGAAHREEAFQACRYILEELKRRVPIWKKEVSPDGEHWVEGVRPG